MLLAKQITLNVRSATDYAIVDNAGKHYTPNEARIAWESGTVKDCNQAFRRLASMNFDLDALKSYYAGCGQ